MKRLFLTLILLLTLPALAFAAEAELLKHRKRYDMMLVPVFVTRVIDGDSFIVTMPSGKEERVRLLCIDTPERGEEGFEESKQELKTRIEGKEIKLKIKKYHKRGNYLHDRYRRLLAEIYAPMQGQCGKRADGGVSDTRTPIPDPRQ